MGTEAGARMGRRGKPSVGTTGAGGFHAQPRLLLLLLSSAGRGSDWGRWVLSVWLLEKLVGPLRTGLGRGTCVTCPETEGMGMSPSVAGGALAIRVTRMLSRHPPPPFVPEPTIVCKSHWILWLGREERLSLS